MSTDDTNAARRGSGSNDLLGLAPEREGQPRMMTVAGGEVAMCGGHWYSPAAVREMLAAEREHVRMPSSAAEAKAMATVAIAWLREHAPDELRPEFRA